MGASFVGFWVTIIAIQVDAVFVLASDGAQTCRIDTGAEN